MYILHYFPYLKRGTLKCNIFVYILTLKYVFMDNMSNSSTAQEGRASEVKSSNVVYKSIIVFLLLFILSTSILFVGVFRKLSYVPEAISDVILQSFVSESCNIPEDEKIEEDVLLTNSQWAIYQYPKFGFFVEVPSDIGYSNAFYEKKMDYPYKWEISAVRNLPSRATIFSDYLESVSITYSPESTPPEYVGGSLGSGSEDSAIFIDFYKNESKYTMAQLSEYFKKYIVTSQIENQTSSDFVVNVTKKLGREAIEFEYNGIEVKHKGYIITNKEYIVVVEYHIYGEDSDHISRANRILESIRFE